MFNCSCCNPAKSYSQRKSLYRHQRTVDPNFVLETKEELYWKNSESCQLCSTTITYNQYKIGNKFCSSSCAATYNNKLYPKRESRLLKEESICISCDTSFFPVRNSKKLYCSKQCDLEYQKKQRNLEVEKGNSSARIVKKYLIEKHGDQCMDDLCEWNNTKRPVKMELEHKDGNSENNNLDNCILLCPCCHSLTPTYKGKNIGNGRAIRRKRYQEGKSY